MYAYNIAPGFKPDQERNKTKTHISFFHSRNFKQTKLEAAEDCKGLIRAKQLLFTYSPILLFSFS